MSQGTPERGGGVEQGLETLPSKIPAGFFAVIAKLILKFIRKFKGSLEKEEQSLRTLLPHFETYYKSLAIKNLVLV